MQRRSIKLYNSKPGKQIQIQNSIELYTCIAPYPHNRNCHQTQCFAGQFARETMWRRGEKALSARFSSGNIFLKAGIRPNQVQTEG